MLLRLLVSILPLAVQVSAGTFAQTNAHQGSGFLKAFSVEAIADPTRGRVKYVDAATADAQNLTYASGDHFVLRADYKTKLSSSGPGRSSVRLKSNKKYSKAIMIFNIRHMPVGCGTWPALWTVGSNWPSQGEIDILEGVNDRGPNQVTLHTAKGCTMPSYRDQSGTTVGTNCDAAVNNNKGCSVRSPETRSYGASFNSNGGGWYALQRATGGIRVWFWSRSASNVPSDVRNGASSINTDNWGTPLAYFPPDSCNMDDYFGDQNIIINLTFCGDWAGNDYGESGCPSTCVDYVNNNPSAFRDAYWDLQWLKIYEF
ncbi:laminarinase [Pterulicium gracile]|uniref:Laminarinase n=1 Tax=Pterulicium gracile TaxID=1884261 RepID=A0A5C3QQH7_9AGAR|nr:laminarinase [Pterula gracilis]